MAVAIEDVEMLEEHDLMFMEGDSIVVLHSYGQDEFLVSVF